MVEKDAVSKDFRKQVLGYGLTTAEIVYRRPASHVRNVCPPQPFREPKGPDCNERENEKSSAGQQSRY